jgi:isoleucyl-tRNA synthetase
MAKDYNGTLNLPKTDFPMRANLPAREPDMLKDREQKDIYRRLTERSAGAPTFILHDGPPFSNGNIHMGTALNKVLKDFIVRYKTMRGFHAPYVPGWDNHGMPIESAIIKKSKLDRKNMTVPEFRSACRDFALNFVNIQRTEFKRLGVMGDWDNPYLTMSPEFEALEVKVFGSMYEKGYIYKGLKPVYWCPHDETALAEAEIEYANDKCMSIYVKFKVRDDRGLLRAYTDLDRTYFVIWTTTTWTIPGNLAICLNPDFEYILMKVPSGETYIVAKELAETVAKKAGADNFEILATMKGKDFELMTASHPLYERDSLIISGRHVTLEAGTGCVHTAPGHGLDDYNVCRNYGIEPFVPVDAQGKMTSDSGPFEGLSYEKANTAIADALQAAGALLASEELEHSYPHCWRCKQPVIYRATPQWFCSVEAFRAEAIAACDQVEWIPAWGLERMKAMISERADWCISRQRHWGLPIPVFYCEKCGKPVCTPETIDAVSALFAKEGSNAWFETAASDILPGGFACPFCEGTEFSKETDTLDGWFDSGSTHIASLDKDNPAHWPADLYLEGGDQYRGWFQSSLLTAVALRGRAPYRAVLTNGWVVDGEGKAMHKSL